MATIYRGKRDVHCIVAVSEKTSVNAKFKKATGEEISVHDYFNVRYKVLLQ